MLTPKKTLLCFVLVLPFVCLTASGQTAETKRAELVKLVHFTGELKTFRDDVTGMISSLKASKPEMPTWFWSALEKEANADEYLQWVIDQFYLVLSEQDVKQLNAFLGAPEKKAGFEELGRLLAETPKQEVPAKIAEFRNTHSQELMNEITAFAQSEAFAKYAEALKRKDSARREEVVRLMFEADRRIRARDAVGQDRKAP